MLILMVLFPLKRNLPTACLFMLGGTVVSGLVVQMIYGKKSSGGDPKSDESSGAE